MRAKEPIIPLRLFRDRTTSLATFASVMVGVAMFGSTVYLSQYFQIAHGMTPDPRRPDDHRDGRRPAGLEHRHRPDHLRTGRVEALPRRRHGPGHRRPGAALHDRRGHRLVRVGVFMAVLGLGLGATMQNLVLAVQNNTAQRDMGAASSVVAFFRSMGGSIGVSALGAVLSHQVAGSVATGSPGSASTPDASGSSTRSRTWPRCRRRCGQSSRQPSVTRPATCS